MVQMNKKLLTFLRILPLIICLTVVVGYLLFGEELSVEAILHYAPANPVLAAVFLVLLYGVKGLSIFFPITVLYIAGGFLFPTPIALLVNTVGVAVELTVPFWMGWISGEEFSARLIQKYPKLGEIITAQQSSAFSLSFFLRVISCLPADAVSMYLGASKMPFAKYLIGSILGTIPGTITTTLIGASITDPASPMFWISVILTVGISAASFLIYFLWRKSKKRKAGDENA